jgi:hypothetical protein
MPHPSEAVWERNQAIYKRIIACVQAQPRSKRDVATAIGLPLEAVSRHMDRLSTLEVISCSGGSSSTLWHLGAKPERALAKRTAERTRTGGGGGAYLLPTVQIPASSAWTLPAPTITVRPDGVKYTYQPAPPPRYFQDVRPGTGAISRDNPRLARLAKAPRRSAAKANASGVVA